MLQRRYVRELAQTLALLAALFGGIGMGAGNALQLAMDPEGAARAHGLTTPFDHHHETDADTFALICADGLPTASPLHEAHSEGPLQLLPARCFFCLDGISPTPTELLAGAKAAVAANQLPTPPKRLDAPRRQRPTLHPARGPPVFV